MTTVTALFIALVVAGIACCAAAIVWSLRTRHVRRLWKAANHDSRKVALVLELESRVRELEAPRR